MDEKDVERRHLERPSPEELIKLIADNIPEYELGNALGFFRDAYKKVFGDFWWGNLKKQMFRTSIGRILAICMMEKWNMLDYCLCNMKWFSTYTKVRPTPMNLCGIKAVHRYQEFLKSEGYVGENGEPTRQTALTRAFEVETQQKSHQRVCYLREHGLLPEQIEERAERYADEILAKAPLASVSLNLPAWLGLSERQKTDRCAERIRAEAKELYMRRWRLSKYGKDLEGRQL